MITLFNSFFIYKQQALLERLGKTAYPFALEINSIAPPSVQLVPAKRYTGAPIGTSYDIRVHLGMSYFYTNYD